MRRVFVVEPYFSGSHRSWAEGIARHSSHDVHLVTHAGGFWKWRMQGGALTLAREIAGLAGEVGLPDALLVSDMVHVAALRGLLPGDLRSVPIGVYFHENQLTYPLPEGEPRDDTYAMTNWLSLAAADAIAFNSAFHRDEVFAALPRLLRRFPDHRHGGFVDDVEKRSVVLPIGIDPVLFSSQGASRCTSPPLVLWNHRWEYDKNPVAFFAALDALVEREVDFVVAVAGEQYQTVPEVFDQARARLGKRIAHFGFADDDTYRSLLQRADVVVSTAYHEFFGLAVAEAIAAGALPVLPNRLSYPELVPNADFLYDDDDQLLSRLEWALTDDAGRRAAATTATEFVGRFAWPTVIAAYDDFLAGLAAGGAA